MRQRWGVPSYPRAVPPATCPRPPLLCSGRSPSLLPGTWTFLPSVVFSSGTHPLAVCTWIPILKEAGISCPESLQLLFLGVLIKHRTWMESVSTGPRQFCAVQPEAMWFWAAHRGHVPSPQFWEESAAWGWGGALYIWLGQPWLGWGSPLLPLRIHATELDRVNQGRSALRFLCLL